MILRAAILTPSVRLLGARRSLLELATAMRPPWKPFVICSGRGGLEARLGEAGIERAVVEHRAWRKGRYALSRYAQVWKIASELLRHPPAVVHANEYHAFPQAWRAARLWAWRAGAPAPPAIAHVRLGMPPSHIQKYNIHYAKYIIAVSRAVAALFDPWPALRERVRVVYNGVNLQGFSPPGAAERERARANLGLAPGDFAVAVVGLIGPRKRQHIAIEALARLRERCPRLRLLFAGEAFRSTLDYERELREAARRQNLEARIQFLGARDPIQPVYAALDLNLLISREEGFGRTIIESGAMGVASIGSRIGGIPELIEENRTGALIALDDVEALCAILRDLHDSPQKAREWGEAARRRIEAHFSIEAHARAMESIWEEAASASRASASRRSGQI